MMQKLYKLVNHEVKGILKYILVLALAMLVLQNVILLIQLTRAFFSTSERFEDILAMCGFPLIFVIAFFTVTGICIMSVYSNYTGSKSIYTLLTLPQRREFIYIAKFISFLTCYLVIWAAQIISVFIGYFLVYNTYLSGRIKPMTNGLFLAFIRSGLLRFMVPLGLKSIIVNAVTVMSFISTFYYGILCERSRKFRGLLAVAANMGLIIYTLVVHIGVSYGDNIDYPMRYIITALKAVIMFFIVFHSMKLVKQGSIA